MILLKIKGKLSKSGLASVLSYIRSLQVEAEVLSEASGSEIMRKPESLSLRSGLWKDRDLDAEELRTGAWTRK